MLYSKLIFRKLIEKMHTHHNTKKRKIVYFCVMKEEKKTNKLEYYVPKSERTLRELHLMFASAETH